MCQVFGRKRCTYKSKHGNIEVIKLLIPSSTKEEVIIFNLQSQQHGRVQLVSLGQFESFPVIRNIVNLKKSVNKMKFSKYFKSPCDG